MVAALIHLLGIKREHKTVCLYKNYFDNHSVEYFTTRNTKKHEKSQNKNFVFFVLFCVFRVVKYKTSYTYLTLKFVFYFFDMKIFGE
jgi:hypothetical protein